MHYFGYSGGGAEDIIGMQAKTFWEISFVYLVGFTAFVGGAATPKFIEWAIKGRVISNWRPAWFHAQNPELIALLILVPVFIISKIALIPTGVYHEYAFDADLMSGPVWTFSTFCSETLILAQIIFLFNRNRHNVWMFCILSGLNGINLLHGTRVFFIITVMIGILYAYMRGYLPLRRIILWGPPSFMAILLIAYLIFLRRMSLSADNAFSMVKIVSPIIWESLFSQLSLIGVLTIPGVWALGGHASHFFIDVVIFSLPRIIVPDKSLLLYSSTFDYLSPKGAFNGYALGLIYFGIFYPLFYFVLGVVGSSLYAKAQVSSWWMILYGFFTADFLFRIMRDGYVIPFKMLINTFELLIILIVWRYIYGFATRHSSSRPLLIKD